MPGCDGAGKAKGSYPSPRPEAAAGRSYPTSKERWLRGCRRAYRSYPSFKVRRHGGEEISFVQGKEQQLRFAGAAMKRYPHAQYRETQVRQELPEGIRGQTH